ncbi:GH1 family beta-glucosidase [Actinomadura rupiterrae]|uniref:GH1 family beta-glucosidase n=1 Tax=Actinomadura rupiterrae TaxID=559627 RepID=UPI0020A43F68|nr:GH1 family beta-glucosidase [Actinomadura rupiterrae]MCP2336610.1 beta-glucosidase [Actinomadura rupiterrae]
MSSFPSDFLWGVSTSALQIEGAFDADGRGPSVWDARTARDGSDARVATGHYERYREDVALLAELGVDAYRFSISWPRVLPSGAGEINQRGLDFYDRLVDELAAHGITPVPTLFHWDTPTSLSWQDRNTADRFAEYAAVVAERLKDRVPRWITINEPAEVTLLGHAIGEHAPGLELVFDALPVAHHLLLGHGKAVQALRAAGAEQIGVAMSHTPVWTASDTDEDRFAADLYDGIMNWLFADPVLTGRYPDGFAEAMPGPVEDDLSVISSPIDWYGINYYNPSLVGIPKPGESTYAGIKLPADLPFELHDIEGYPHTDFDWPVVPAGLRDLLVSLRNRYADRLPPVLITENGCSYDDPQDDARRIEYLDGHIRAVRSAMDEGVDVRGYFVWSLLDNWEWSEGFRQRFGLVHVDYETLKRTPKASFAWYRDLIRTTKP